MPPCPSRPTAGLSARVSIWRLCLSLCAGLVCALACATARADAYDPPDGYYPATLGATPKQQLHNIIAPQHDQISYDDARVVLGFTDADPANANNLLTVYDRTSISKVWSTNPLIWNREHTWPQSRGTSSGLGHSDLFNLRPALVSNNGDRGNLNYGGAFGSNGGNPGTVSDGGTFFYPGNVEAGVVARQAFYMDVRYDGTDFPDLQLVAGNPAASQNKMGNLTRLLEYHFLATPDTFERNRNQVIYNDGTSSADRDQNNRNPFIDRPEFVWPVFVDQANDSALALQGGVAVPGAPGATTLNVDLGRRLVGSALPAGQSVTLNKAGVDGTYYSVTAGEGATSSVNGRFNAFAIGSTGSKAITVGLTSDTSTASAGLRSGTVTIDNLDITGGGGASSGANDGNDVITASLRVLDHANASFASASDVNTLSYNFGTIAMGAPAPTFSFDIFNLSGLANFTSGLDLDGIVSDLPSDAFSTNLAPFSGASTLAAGASRSFLATFDTSATGTFRVTYTLDFSDENLVGATSLASLSLTLNGTVAAAVTSADFDGDNDIDGDDFLRWQRSVGLSGTATRADGDANGDHHVDGLDLAVWREQFGTTPPMARVAPEPATWLFAVGGWAAAMHRGRRQRTVFA